jgi:hypothetical protein
MNDIMRRILFDLRARQMAGQKMPCPRCGRDTMDPVMENNPESRRETGLRICKRCLQQERDLEVMNNPLAFPLYSWAVFQPDTSKNEFKHMTNAEAERYIEDEYIFYLMDLYSRYTSGRDQFADLDLEARHQCPGLTRMYSHPFWIRFDTAEGYLSIQFREIGGEVQYAFHRHEK